MEIKNIKAEQTSWERKESEWKRNSRGDRNTYRRQGKGKAKMLQ